MIVGSWVRGLSKPRGGRGASEARCAGSGCSIHRLGRAILPSIGPTFDHQCARELAVEPLAIEERGEQCSAECAGEIVLDSFLRVALVLLAELHADAGRAFSLAAAGLADATRARSPCELEAN